VCSNASCKPSKTANPAKRGSMMESGADDRLLNDAG
jgi:hypothetical protein